MRKLSAGENPKLGATLRIMFEGKVISEPAYGGGLFTMEGPNGTKWYFRTEEPGKLDFPNIWVVAEAPRKFRTGAMYRSNLEGRIGNPRQEFFLRLRDGWQSVDGRLFPDNDEHKRLLSHIVNSLVELGDKE